MFTFAFGVLMSIAALLTAATAVNGQTGAPAQPTLILIDADTDQVVPTINAAGARIVDLSLTSARNFTVRADSSDAGSVLFNFNNGARYKIENVAPFALAGDVGGNLLPVSPALAVGTYTISATAYSEDGATGAASQPSELVFSLFDGATKLSIDSGNVARSVNAFIGDAFFGGPEGIPEGDTLTVSSRVFPVQTTGVAGAAPAAVYNTQRILSPISTSNFEYRIRPFAFGASTGPLRPNTGYRLRLHFAELTEATAGERQFNVFVTDLAGRRPLLSNYDIFAEAGGARRAAVEEFSVVSRSDGSLILSFERGASGVPVVNGIELILAQ